ncbi:hypothetical protein [Neosynechococcus sphagnicola]|nr:hypothetical protein [Neosynechococcus sphagnicola]
MKIILGIPGTHMVVDGPALQEVLHHFISIHRHPNLPEGSE